MSEVARRKAIIGVAPHSDRSGFGATVIAYTDELGRPVFEVNTTWRIDASVWPELREAIESALALATLSPT